MSEQPLTPSALAEVDAALAKMTDWPWPDLGDAMAPDEYAEMPVWCYAHVRKVVRHAPALLHAARECERMRGGFPIQAIRGAKPHPLSIPWEIAELAYSQYAAKYGTSQTLARLAERGGFGPGEMDLYLPDWRERCSEAAALRADNARLRATLARKQRAIELGNKLLQTVIPPDDDSAAFFVTAAEALDDEHDPATHDALFPLRSAPDQPTQD